MLGDVGIPIQVAVNNPLRDTVQSPALAIALGFAVIVCVIGLPQVSAIIAATVFERRASATAINHFVSIDVGLARANGWDGRDDSKRGSSDGCAITWKPLTCGAARPSLF